MNLDAQFPNLAAEGHRVSSPSTLDYNCVAWAADIVHDWWWPDPNYFYYWPDGIRREATVDAFVAAFARLGYTPCATSDHEDGFEKVAIYVRSHIPQHMARQLPDGAWTSKLGQFVDIEHTLRGLEGTIYGAATVFLKRPRPPL